MKTKRFIFIGMIIVFIVCFSAIALGAGKNSDNTYVGTWYLKDKGSYIFIYPCHVGETGYESSDHSMIMNREFDWCVDNGYLVIHYTAKDGYTYIDCYLSSDGGETMEIITGKTSSIYTKIE